MRKFFAALALILLGLTGCKKEETFNPASEDDFIGTCWTGKTTGTTESGGQTVGYTTQHEVTFSENKRVTVSSRSQLDTKATYVPTGNSYTCIAGSFSLSGNTLNFVFNELVEENVDFLFVFPLSAEGTVKGNEITIKESPVGSFKLTKQSGKRL